ncbi:hypothetical protein J5I95_18175 [Candidatus Poribacteria bacterium]|nr:hypothetical protein [Candidatus Poribacteria bacterium]
MKTRFVIIPNKYDECPFKEALAVLEEHGKDFLERLNKRKVDENMSKATWQNHIRCAADEVYWTRVHKED